MADLVVFISAFMGLNLFIKKAKRRPTQETPSAALMLTKRPKVKQKQVIPDG
ncbi:hypothetical protein [Sphingomonas jaspsi]|uniref:hypothetical protein n=1 Tax=Sphingomonas jaspsi TaxID=392409 RepID=UPI00146FBDE0|nr:hypothetical protein [Sphingomonas jaspsi]